jgi:NADH dehydrogenase (ubiquinone) 1 alpha subcomplex subunit 5
MRRTFQLLAAIKPSRYLEGGAPTGLTGLFTHPSPRSALIYTYSATLEKLQQFPESSLYRQSTEALTKHRLNIVSSVVPEGHKEWSEKVKKTIAEHPEVFNTPEGEVPHDENKHVKVTKGGRQFVVSKVEQAVDDLKDEWDGEEATVGFSAGGMTEAEEAKDQSRHDLKRPGSDVKTVNLDPEPVLTADQYVYFGMGSLGASWTDGIAESSRLRTRLVLD